MAYTSYAAIAISTAGITMRIYEMNKKTGIKLVDELVHHTHLGQEIYSEGRFSFESTDEICQIIADFQRRLKEYGTENLQLYISHALSEAFNLDFLVTQIRVKTGLKAKVLNNSKEHYLMLQAISTAMNDFNELIKKKTLILDIGYGNVQTTLYDHSELLSTQNYRLGITRVEESIGGLEVRSTDYPSLVEEMVQHELNASYKAFGNVENFIVVGSGMHYLNAFYKEMNTIVFSRKEIEKIADDLYAGKTILGLDEDASYTLTPLFVLIRCFFRMTDSKFLLSPDIHLCSGMAADYAYKKLKIFSGHHFTEDRFSMAIHYAKHFNCDLNHNLYIRDIAKAIFKVVGKPYGLNNKDQIVLELACILKDCGRYINPQYSPLLDYAIVKNSEFINLSDVNRILTANALRYRDTSFPLLKELNEAVLNNEFYVILARVTAILKLAMALDAGHLQKFNDVHVSIKDGQLIVRATSKEDVVIETNAFNDSRGLFEEVFGLKPVFKCKRSV